MKSKPKPPPPPPSEPAPHRRAADHTGNCAICGKPI